MKACLVTMPWQSLDLPCLPLSLLTAQVRARRPQHEIRTHYANISWAAYVLASTASEVTPDDYSDLVEDGLFHGLGEWVFTASLYEGETWPERHYAAHPATPRMHDGPACIMRELAADFVRLTAEEVLASSPDLIGITSTFMQNVPSLALAAELKRRAPEVVIVMGGGNCDGPMGAALHRNFGALDYVVSGEGEQAFLKLLDALESGPTRELLRRVPGLCWSDEGKTASNPPASGVLGMQAVPLPDFDDYFAALDASPVREYVEPQLIHEAARGCWWGERKQCTFCGLNGSTMVFRSKPPERVFSEIDHHVRRHGVLDVVMVDNIMDMEYIGTLVPRLADTGWDLRVHYEVKSNLRRDHVEALARAGVVHIQPGIESLSTRVLKLMAKGVNSVTNVRLLRDCEELRVTTPWNYLYGFPGEAPDDYLPIVAQLPNLHHLQPPRNATRIALERFSPYHERPELGFGPRRPAEFYRHVYDLPERELMDLVFIFDCDDAGIGGAVEQDLLEAVDAWQDAYFDSTLTYEDRGRELVIVDRRAHREHRDHVLREPWEIAGYRLLAEAQGRASLAKRLAGANVCAPEAAELDAWLAGLVAAGLAFGDAGHYVALATADAAVRVPIEKWR